MIRFPRILSTKFLFMVDKIINSLNTIKKKKPNLQQLFFPDCKLCGEQCEHNLDICCACQQDLPHLKHHCKTCSLPLPLEQNDAQEHTLTCGECLSSPPSFTQTHCAFYYAFPITHLIHLVKYQHQRHWLSSLTSILCERIQHDKQLELPDLLIPIPIHHSKKRTRGFNQAELIARYLGKQFEIPLNTRILIKNKTTETQTKLNKQERLKNLKGSMNISRKVTHRKAIHNKHIVLIDDVVTTKATCELASQLLLKAGAKKVDVWCLARTPKAYLKQSAT